MENKLVCSLTHFVVGHGNESKSYNHDDRDTKREPVGERLTIGAVVDVTAELEDAAEPVVPGAAHGYDIGGEGQREDTAMGVSGDV